MKIELLYFSDCPNYQGALKQIEEVTRTANIAAEVELRDIRTEEEALRSRFLGSPTIRVNGEDIDPAARSSTDYGLKCRVYRQGNRLAGVPPRELLEQAIQEARNGHDVRAANR